MNLDTSRKVRSKLLRTLLSVPKFLWYSDIDDEVEELFEEFPRFKKELDVEGKAHIARLPRMPKRDGRLMPEAFPSSIHPAFPQVVKLEGDFWYWTSCAICGAKRNEGDQLFRGLEGLQRHVQVEHAKKATLGNREFWCKKVKCRRDEVDMMQRGRLARLPKRLGGLYRRQAGRTSVTGTLDKPA
ncbi:hypothetical protein AC578_6228 [Pseudocercospora eumusae]|uniref:Uncharacterized protein n=1 Tax=Pseudocercospora eumusae TaxID=321146 RepID=A0A139H340_9PEZI|nr:hypothetical protein AC578_6228 [Pseudocercospora eumusae]